MARSFRPLFVDVDPIRRDEIAEALADAGWTLVHSHAVAGTDAFRAALGRRGWDVVIYGGEGADPVPARKAHAMVRVADPQLPFVAAVPSVRSGDLSAFVQGFGPDALFAPDPADIPAALGPVLVKRLAERGEGNEAFQLLLAQQAITDHVAAGLEPDELCARVLETLGETLGWTYGAVWRPDGETQHAALQRALARPRRRPAGVRVRRGLAPHADRARPRPARPHVRVPPPVVDRRRRRGRQHAALRPRRARGADHRGRLPDRARRRLRGRDRVLLRGDRGAGLPGRGDVRHGRRAARAVPRAPPAAGRREPPRGVDAPRGARPRPALPRRRRDDDRRARRRAAASCSSTARAARCSAARSATCSARTGSRSPCPSTSATRCAPAWSSFVAGDEESAGHHQNAVVTLDGQLRTIAWHNTVLRDARRDDRRARSPPART